MKQTSHKPFLDTDFLLETGTAQALYHEFAAPQPILDYHCHLPPEDIAANRTFTNLTKIWLDGDHYKWRAMRAHGINEELITGPTDDFARFEAWASTVPFLIRNPLYHWTHMELQNPFHIHKLLATGNAREVYDQAGERLQALPVHSLLARFNVKLVCTTDDPIDDLAHHRAHHTSDGATQMLPTFRPDKAMVVRDVQTYNTYLDKLSNTVGYPIHKLDDAKQALADRHAYFHQHGCRLADHGLDYIPIRNGTDPDAAFLQVRSGQLISLEAQEAILLELLIHCGLLHHKAGWAMQLHLGALRNNNARYTRRLGADAGFDSIGDYPQAAGLAGFLNTLDQDDRLCRTILYNLNPADNELFATMIGNFNDGTVPGKIQYGSAWWFLDQKSGMERQLDALSNMGLLSQFVGMLTDSRSFLSYSRHEYFRRILCNMLGNDVEQGLLPNDIPHLGSIVSRICYGNAKDYFRFPQMTTANPIANA